MSSRKPPPIPRKANIQRAREQIANDRNRARARAMVEKARENTQRRQVLTREQEEGVERLFQSRNELDALRLMEARQRARERVIDFQERQAQANQVAQNIAEAREIGARTRAVADVRGMIRQKLDDPRTSAQINLEAVAGRRLDTGSVGFANALFGGAGLQAVAEQEFGRRQARGTKIRETIPEPEPEPQPEPAPVRQVSGNPNDIDFRGNPIVGGVKGRPRPRGGDSHGNIHVKSQPQPEPEPEAFASAGGSNFGRIVERG